MAKKLEMPKLGENVTPEHLVDEIGRIRRRVNDLEKLRKYLTEALKARWPKDTPALVGEKYTCVPEKQVQRRISKDLVEQFVPAETLPKLYKDIEINKMNVKKIGEEEETDLDADNDDELFKDY